ncbi:hypothetical protein HG536_0B03840 [Torulaspora globosa]|uniref:Uncharacterized protein n=1 Tax=Torulaspora globosa TaxID=48254 RepID=A0A7G3ZDD4_9SACH|nr:uncharacterized protein HG536_0B03840 [Torulaspora globosa]QLL31520.1 hypothetical protein HG536_0B03840 [Torulaspora globosa]
MERVLELEREHVQLHDELLSALDKLFLLQLGHGNLKDREAESSIAIRRQLQLSLEKSAAILTAIQRMSKLQHSEDSDVRTTEDILASRLANLMQENYELDYTVKELLEKEEKANQDLLDERTRYFDLIAKMTEVSDKIHKQKQASLAAGALPDSTPVAHTPREKEKQQAIIDQNEQIQELLVALKVHGGYDPLS